MNTPAMLNCTTCGRACKGEFGLKVHMKSHERKEEVTPAKPDAVKDAVVEAAPATCPTTSMTATGMAQVGLTPAPEKAYNYKKYLELPTPIKEHLENVFGNWLNCMEVGQEWRDDFGGYGLYIKVPREYSTEWQEVSTAIYDNTTRKATGEKTIITPDVRWKPIKDIAEVKAWIDLVKGHIITNAYKRGIRLPNTNTGIDMTKATLEQYETAVAGNKTI